MQQQRRPIIKDLIMPSRVVELVELVHLLRLHLLSRQVPFS